MVYSLESDGLAPGFRAAAQDGQLDLCELDGPIAMGALRAGACDLRWMSIRRTGDEVPDPTPAYLADIAMPGDPIAIRAVRPDAAFLRASYCDATGNLYYCGNARVDFLIASSSRRVIAVVEELREQDQTLAGEARIPSYLVNEIIIAPRSGWPGSVGGHYPADHVAFPRVCIPNQRPTHRRSGQAEPGRAGPVNQPVPARQATWPIAGPPAPASDEELRVLRSLPEAALLAER